jgi:hypothetical protein
LVEQVRSRRGYHVVHWSGHGHHNRLELRTEDGGQELLTGQQLVDLFTQAGGFIPRLVFLSACLSGTLVDIRNWQQFQAAMASQSGGDGKQADDRNLDDVLQAPPGLHRHGPGPAGHRCAQVIAMRYEVGDDYARALAHRFYQRLLADPAEYPADSALALARSELLAQQDPAAGFSPVDHATPLIFGAPSPITAPRRRSAQLDRRRPRPQPLLAGGRTELDPPQRFVGRGTELTRLADAWLPREQAAVAVVQGLAGLGKTALAAEAVHLWHTRFDWVLAHQAKPHPLTLDEFYRNLDARLALESRPYREKCEASPYAHIYLEPTDRLTGTARYARMRTNLLEALRDEAILLVLDNFETNLLAHADSNGYACQDPEWDRLLAELARQLPPTASRLLLTTRHRPSALAANDGHGVLWLPLGPLPPAEWSVYVRSHAALRQLYFADDAGWRLVRRLLAVSRGHPLILDRLATLAPDRAALRHALDQLEQRGLHTLPDLFVTDQTDAQHQQEQAYLEDVAIGAVDLLLQCASPAARRLLWVVTLANEPVTEDLVAGVWSRRSVEADEEPPVGPLLAELHAAGLLILDNTGDPCTWFYHELVRERIAAWMDQHPDEQGNRTAEAIWIAYGERYAAAFNALYTAGREGARAQAAEAGRRALSYLVRARAFERLGSFASTLVTGSREPELLRQVIAELQAAADEVPPGETRWKVRTYLADALGRAGRPGQALGLYQQAAAEAEAAERWADVGTICGNWANALCHVGPLKAAKEMYRRGAEAEQKAGQPRWVHVVGWELEALRVDVMQGQAEQVLPEINKRLDDVRT